MKDITREKLFQAWHWCDEEDKSTEFMFQYMADYAKVDYDVAVTFVIETTEEEREEWYQKQNNKTNMKAKYLTVEELNNSINVNKTIKRWEDLHFLETCDNKRNGALGCEILANTFLESIGEGNYDARLETLMFPVIIRVMREFNEDLSTFQINSMVKEVLDSFPLDELIKTEQREDAHLYGDIEALMVSKFSEHYVGLKKMENN